MARTDELSAVSDRVIRFRLKRPFPLLPEALAEPYCSIMPERLAKTDPFKPVEGGDGFGTVQIRRRRTATRSARGFREARQLPRRSAGRARRLAAFLRCAADISPA